MIEPGSGRGHGADMDLARECHAFCRYLVDGDPDPSAVSRYRQAHVVHPFFRSLQIGPFDRVLLRLALLRPWTTRLADSYARLLAPRSVLRAKLILLLAILEVSSRTYGSLETPTATSSPRLVFGLAGRGVGFAIRVAVAAIPLLPLQLSLSVGRRLGGRRAPPTTVG